MSREEIKEIIKAFAYGYNTKQVAENCDISEETAKAYEKEYAAEIAEKRSAANG